MVRRRGLSPTGSTRAQPVPARTWRFRRIAPDGAAGGGRPAGAAARRGASRSGLLRDRVGRGRARRRGPAGVGTRLAAADQRHRHPDGRPAADRRSRGAGAGHRPREPPLHGDRSGGRGGVRRRAVPAPRRPEGVPEPALAVDLHQPIADREPGHPRRRHRPGHARLGPDRGRRVGPLTRPPAPPHGPGRPTPSTGRSTCSSTGSPSRSPVSSSRSPGPPASPGTPWEHCSCRHWRLAWLRFAAHRRR